MVEDLTTSQNVVKVSKYSSAFFNNQAIRRLWDEASIQCVNGMYHKWNAKLDMIWAELGGDVEENGDEEKAFRNFQKELADTGSLHPQNPKGFKQSSEGYNERKAKQYEILLRKSLWLKRLQNVQGKGSAYADDDEYEL